MEGDSGKLFIGGISWDTNEELLTEYFGQFGEVAEAVIMRDRVTGRARGFGFIVFADPSVADRVILEKHMIDGRLVEAKKAIPRDDQLGTGPKTPNSILASPSPGPGTRTRKIFVGGLPSSVTEPDFKLYFEQFGSISDVVVMYDHNTQRPRGFGFVTFDSEEAVDLVLAKNTFHELNGKMVEVKRAVPKELSPSPARSPAGMPAGGYPVTRMSNILNWYSGYGSGPSPYNTRVDGRLGLGGRNGLSVSSLGHGGYGIGMGIDNMAVGAGFGTGSRGPGLYGSNRYGGGGLNPGAGYGGLNEDARSVFARNNLWGNGTGTGFGTGNGTGSVNPNPYLNSSMARNLGPFDNGLSGNNGGGGGGGSNWNWIGPVGGGIGGDGIDNNNNNNNNGFGLMGGPSGYGRNENRVDMGNGSFDNGYGLRNSNPEFYGNDPIYGDKTWSFSNNELDAPGPFNYMDNYANNETSRGISS